MFRKIDSFLIGKSKCTMKMTRFSSKDLKYEQSAELEYEEEEPEPWEPPANTLYYEQTGTERHPTFTVYLQLNDQVISERIFQTEEDATLCLKTLFPILEKESSIAVQEFQAYE